MSSSDYELSPKNVRSFFRLVLKHVVPKSLTAGSSDNQWEVDFRDTIGPQLEALLGSYRYQVAFDDKAEVRTCDQQEEIVHYVPFLVSKVIEFKAEDIVVPRPGYTGFKVKDKTFFSVREALYNDILGILNGKVSIHSLAYEMSSSRSFGFEIFYEGYFVVRCDFTDNHIKSEGGVRDAIESFFDEIESAIVPFGFEITSTPSKYQRSKSNEYHFDIYYGPVIAFGERDVYGEGCYAIRGDSTAEEVNEYGIDFEKTLTDQANDYLNIILNENLPAYADLVFCEIGYVDDPGEVFDIGDELIVGKFHKSEDYMLKKSVSELQFVKPRNPLPTVEVDIDSLPQSFHGYGSLVTKALASLAEKSTTLKATIYVYQGMSTNFQQQTWSAFFGVAGDKKILDRMLKQFKSEKGVKARYSDYIEPSSAIKEFHVEDGHVWQPLEADTWHTYDTYSTEGTVTELDVLESQLPQGNEYEFNTATPSRFRVARSDASIGTIRRKIEEVFGLPEGAVALCGPDGRALRRDAKIATLRRRWEQ